MTWLWRLAYGILVFNAIFLSSVAWERHALMTAIDGETTGFVVSAEPASSRSSVRNIVVGYQVDGHFYSVHGSASEAGLDDGALENRQVRVYYRMADPARASLTRGARYQEVAGIAGALVLASAIATYQFLLRRRRRLAAAVPEAVVVNARDD